MIPKIIHYCWLSDDPIPENLQTYMKSWKEVLVDYEFVKWDFSKFNKGSSKWVSDAFDNKKYMKRQPWATNMSMKIWQNTGIAWAVSSQDILFSASMRLPVTGF